MSVPEASKPEENQLIVQNQKIPTSGFRCWVTVAVMVFINFSLIGGFFMFKMSSEPEICYSKECIGLVSMLKNSQNLSISPCDDFYGHVCGRFHEHQPIVAPSGLIDFRILQTMVSTIVRTTPKFSTKPKEQLRIFAKSCNNHSSVGSEKFEDLLDDIMARGGFPMIQDNWDKEKFDFSDFLSNYIQINRNRLGFLSIEPYRKRNASGIHNKLFISPGPHWSFHRSMGLKMYKNGVKWVLGKLVMLQNSTLNLEKFEKEFQKAVDLEAHLITLAEYSTMDYYSSDPDNIKTLSDLISEIPEVDWLKIVKKIPNSNMKNEDLEMFLGKIDVHGGNFFFGKGRKLANLISSTPKATLANYVVFRQLLEVSVIFYDQEQPGQRKLLYSTDRGTYCAEQLLDHFPMPSMNIFIESSEYKMENLKIAERVFNDIKEEYKEIFQESEFLDDELKSLLRKKVDWIQANFGYQEFFEKQKNGSVNALERMYETLDLHETDSTWRVYWKLWRHQSEQIVEHIVYNTVLNPIHTKTFRHHGSYTPFVNHFAITLPYLSYPFLDPSYPANAIYGCLSTMIGHEIGHGFDDFHRNFDWIGRKNGWWKRAINASLEYEKGEKCLRDQYSEYEHPGFGYKMNGTITRLELVGDHLGLKTAFRAFKKAEKHDKYRLPGMENVSKEQMFFYNYAQSKCEVINPDLSSWAYKYHSHPIDRFRVNGVLQNMPEFAEAFQCRQNEPMNPKEKCKLF